MIRASRSHKFSLSILLVLIPIFFPSCHSSRKLQSSVHKNPKGQLESVKTDNLKSRIIEEAFSWLGTPYKYGGHEKGVGADCSGMVMMVYNDVAGVKIPRNSAKQAEFCTTLDARNVTAGDLVFFATGREAGRVSHVGIIVDDGNFIHASSSKGVVLTPLSSPYFQRTFIKFGRVPIAGQTK